MTHTMYGRWMTASPVGAAGLHRLKSSGHARGTDVDAKQKGEGPEMAPHLLGWLTGLEPATPRITTWCSTS